ncbi:MAG: hypothetical protein WCS21_04805 [Lachnospiraceae bacterium]
MKRTCKNIDITDPVFVSQSIGHFMAHRTGKEMNRSDIVKLYAEYGTSDNIAVQMVDDFKGGDLKLTPVRMTKKRDSSNGKLRDIAIEGIKQQLYEQTVFDALKDAAKCVGEYQCTCLKNQPKYLYKKDGTVQTKIVGRGQIWAKDVMYGWWSDPKIRYCVKSDIYHNYATVPQDQLMDFLSKRVKNDNLLKLITMLLPESGLSIGSVMSIILDAIYLSQIYHHMQEDLPLFERRGKKYRPVEHTMLWMDDIYLLTKSKKAANFAIRELIRFTGTLGMTIKPSWRIISKIDPPKDHKIHQKRQSYIDIVGYRVYPDKVTLRNRDYVKCKRAFKRLNKKKSLHNSQSAVSYYGMLKNSDSYRFRKKYHVKRLNRQARRYISHESKIQRETGPGEVYDHRNKDNGADLHQ